MKKDNYLVSALLMLIGSICFGIVTYGHFYRNNYMLFGLCLIATICDFISFILNFLKYNNNK